MFEAFASTLPVSVTTGSKTDPSGRLDTTTLRVGLRNFPDPTGPGLAGFSFPGNPSAPGLAGLLYLFNPTGPGFTGLQYRRPLVFYG